MTRRVANNPSGKYLRMTEDQQAKSDAAFRRAVERQTAEEDRRAAEARRRYPHLFKETK